MLVNVFGTKFVILIHVRKMRQASGHSSARNLIMKHIVISSIHGCHTLIVVSNFKVTKKICLICHFNQFTDDPCELYCTDSEDTLIVPWGDSASDGTPCNIGTNDMCISGICRVSIFTISSDSQSNKTIFLFFHPIFNYRELAVIGLLIQIQLKISVVSVVEMVQLVQPYEMNLIKK